MTDVAVFPRKHDPIAEARRLGPAIEAAADEIESTQQIPEPLLTQLHEARIFRTLLPRSAGGDQCEPWTYFRTVEEIASHDGSTGWIAFVLNSSALIVPYVPLEAALKIYADPRGCISWGPPNQHRATAVPGGYRVTGEWHFSSGRRQATWTAAHCQVVESDGSLRLNRWGKPTVRTLLMPKDQTTTIPDWNTIGMRGTASEGYSARDVFVPELFSGTREDATLRRDKGPLYAFTTQGLYAIGVAAVALGIARAMHEAFMTLSLAKSPRNQVKLADNPVIQREIAHHEAKLGAARAYIVEVLRAAWAGADDMAPLASDQRARVRLACSHGIETALEVSDRIYKSAGTSAIFLGSPFERRFRDIHTMSQQIQSRDAHFEAVGNVLLNGDPGDTFLG